MRRMSAILPRGVVSPVRTFSTRPALLATKSTQGHTTRKSSDPLHASADVQSASTRSARKSRSEASSNSSGGGQPMDAARQGNTGGESKRAPAEDEAKDPGFRGSLKDQVGGQDGGSGVQVGGTEAAGSGVVEGVKEAVSTGFEGLRNLRRVSSGFESRGFESRG